MAADADEKVAARLFEAMMDRDWETVAELIADDAIWHSPGSSPLSGDFRGRDAIIRYAQRSQAAASALDFEIHDILASDDHVVALVKTSAARGDTTFESPYTYVFHVGSGRIAEAWTFPYDVSGREAFFAD